MGPGGSLSGAEAGGEWKDPPTQFSEGGRRSLEGFSFPLCLKEGEGRGLARRKEKEGKGKK